MRGVQTADLIRSKLENRGLYKTVAVVDPIVIMHTSLLDATLHIVPVCLSVRPSVRACLTRERQARRKLERSD